MALLFYTTQDFDPEGNPSPGVPLLLDDDMRLIEPACLWFFRLALINGRTRSPSTWRSYAEALYDWFQTCAANGWQWDQVTEQHLAAYRNRMLAGPSSCTGQPFSLRTVNGRLRRVIMFYRWALRQKFISELPCEYEDVRVSGRSQRDRLAHVEVNPGVAKANVLTVREQVRFPHALTPDELHRIQRHLCRRDRLIVQWAVTTGVRRKEVLGLTHHLIPATQHLSDGRGLIPIQITVTKGDQPRYIHPPVRLLDRTNDYLSEERAALIKRHRSTTGYVTPTALWLSEQGTPLSKEALHKNFRIACRKAGATATFHDLRHTFAITMLANLQRQVARNPSLNLNPLKTLQVLLGHAHLSTTEIYLQALEPNMEMIEESIEALYENMR